MTPGRPKMRILVVSTSFPSQTSAALAIGGRFVLADCLAYEHAGAEVAVVTPDIPGCPRRERFGRSIEVHRFSYVLPRRWQTISQADARPLYERRGPWFCLQLPLLMAAFVWAICRRGWHVDIVHCNWTLTALLAMPLHWLRGTPVVLTIRGSDLRLMPRWLNRWLCRHTGLLLNPYGPLPVNLKQCAEYPGRWVHLPILMSAPPAGADDAPPRQPGEFRVVLVGRLDSVKRDMGIGFFPLLDAVARLRGPYPCLRLRFVGDGNLRPALEQRAHELSLQDIVAFDGYRDPVGAHLLAADLVAGGMGLNTVCQEAMLLGRPQLLPQVRDWYENVWVDRDNALLYEPNDADSMTEALRHALEAAPAERQLLARRSQETGHELVTTVEDGGGRYLELFRQFLRESRGTAARLPCRR